MRVSLRQALNKRPMLSTSLAAAGVIAIGILIGWQIHSASPSLPGAYFSDDDGASFFSDNPKRVTPFDHHGRQAVRAHVFKGADGKKFVGYLERNTPASGAIIRRVQNRKPTHPIPTPAEMGVVLSGKEFKKPGSGQWVPSSRGADAEDHRGERPAWEAGV